MTYLLQLAVGLILELGLDKMPRIPLDSQKSVAEATQNQSSREANRRKQTGPSLEERRALAGGFYLSSVYACIPLLFLYLLIET